MEDVKVTAGPMQYTDDLPSEDRLDRFMRLSHLKLDDKKSFKQWVLDQPEQFTEIDLDMLYRAWTGSREAIKAAELFNLVRTTAVFDESFRLPQLDAGKVKVNAEQKFAALMKRFVALALSIQVSEETPLTETPQCQVSLLQ